MPHRHLGSVDSTFCADLFTSKCNRLSPWGSVSRAEAGITAGLGYNASGSAS